MQANIGPICLPEPDAEFGGKSATATAWGETHAPSETKKQLHVQKKVELTVSNKKYKHYKMFGTLHALPDNVFQDLCSGDSGKE